MDRIEAARRRSTGATTTSGGSSDLESLRTLCREWQDKVQTLESSLVSMLSQPSIHRWVLPLSKIDDESSSSQSCTISDLSFVVSASEKIKNSAESSVADIESLVETIMNESKTVAIEEFKTSVLRDINHALNVLNNNLKCYDDDNDDSYYNNRSVFKDPADFIKIYNPTENICYTLERFANLYSDLVIETSGVLSDITIADKLCTLKKTLLNLLEQELSLELSSTSTSSNNNSGNVPHCILAYSHLKSLDLCINIISLHVTSFLKTLKKNKREGYELLFNRIVEFVKGLLLKLSLQSFKNDDNNISMTISKAIMTSISSYVISAYGQDLFKPGIPNVFIKNYNDCDAFITILEQNLLSDKHNPLGRKSSLWNTKVYLTIRRREILNNDSTDVIDQMLQCVSDGVYIEECSVDFLELSIVVLAKFVTEGMSKTTSTLVFAQELDTIYEQVRTNVIPTITKKILNNTEELEASELFYKDSMDLFQKWKSLVWKDVIGQIAAQCSKFLPSIRTLKNQYQMTNKEFVTGTTPPSSFVSQIVGTLKEFSVDNTTSRITNQVLEIVCEEYYDIGSDVITTSRDLEMSLRKRNTSTTTTTTNTSDTMKIKQQMLLDIQTFKELLIKDGIITVSNSVALETLEEKIGAIEVSL